MKLRGIQAKVIKSSDALLLSRRQILKASVAVGAFAMGAPIPSFSAVKKGGRLVIGTTGGSAGDSLDPTKLTSVGHGMIGYTLGNGLTEIEEIMKIQSKLIVNRSAYKTNIKQLNK